MSKVVSTFAGVNAANKSSFPKPDGNGSEVGSVVAKRSKLSLDDVLFAVFCGKSKSVKKLSLNGSLVFSFWGSSGALGHEAIQSELSCPAVSMPLSNLSSNKSEPKGSGKAPF